MIDKLEDSELCRLATAGAPIAIAECIDGLGCSVFADGRQLVVPWVCKKVADLLGCPILNGAVLTSKTVPKYFILKRDPEYEEFTVLNGPLDAAELRSALSTAKSAGT